MILYNFIIPFKYLFKGVKYLLGGKKTNCVCLLCKHCMRPLRKKSFIRISLFNVT